MEMDSGVADLSQGGVELAVAGVGLFHGGCVVGFYRGGYADGRGAGSFYRRPCVDAGSGEQGGSEGSAFFGLQDFDGLAVDVGLNLTPEWTACAASAEANALDRDAQFVEEGEGVAEAHGYAFEHGADEVGAGCGWR